MNERGSRTEHSQQNDELDWLAFRYIADELGELARARFEARLQDDAVAQQAVVDAVKQAQLIYEALDETPVALRRPLSFGNRTKVVTSQYSPKRTGILFTSAAALAMLVAGWGWHARRATESAVAGGESERLASAWVESLVTSDDDETDFGFDGESQAVESDEGLPDDWMFVALNDLEHSLKGTR